MLTGVTSAGTPLPRSSGVPVGGCTGESERALGVSSTPLSTETASSKTVRPKYSDLLSQIGLSEEAAMQHSAAVTHAVDAWSACMASHGYRYSSPERAGTDLDVDTPKPSQLEVLVAETDVMCNQQNHVLAAELAFCTGFEKSAIDEHIQELQALNVIRLEQLSKAARRIRTAFGTA